MTTDPSFTLVITRLRAGDQDAASEVFRRFVHRLIALASRQFDARFRSKEDPEDVVLSVLRSFIQRDVRSPFDLYDWDGLWALLASITVRKCSARREFWKAARRDVEREVARAVEPEGVEWHEAIARGPTPEQAAILAEMIELLISRLEVSHREIAQRYLEGYTPVEIAKRCSCSERTVGRVVARLREWLLKTLAEDLEG